jgi:hypothetical protein
MQWLLTLAAEAASSSSTAIDPSSILPALSTLGSLGFAVWYAWYTTTVSIPKLLDVHRQERLEMQVRFDACVHELLTEMKEQRIEFAAWRNAATKS